MINNNRIKYNDPNNPFEFVNRDYLVIATLESTSLNIQVLDEYKEEDKLMFTTTVTIEAI